MSKTFKATEVAEHKKPDSLWIIVEGNVYDVTKFQNDHPGGKKILQRVGGKDATAQFWKYHNEGVLKKYGAQLQIGSLEGKAAPPPEPKKEEPKKEEPKEEPKKEEPKKEEPKKEEPKKEEPKKEEPKKEEPKKEEQVVPMQTGPVAPAPTSEVREAKESLETYGKSSDLEGGRRILSKL